jgi:hypothetical protein
VQAPLGRVTHAGHSTPRPSRPGCAGRR